VATDDDLSLNAWAVLALLVDDGPQHGFALSKKLARPTDLGRVWSVSRPLVYRALEQLDQRRLVVGGPEVPSRSGPTRQEFSATTSGIDAVTRWRRQPVDRLRQVRPDLILKLTLSHRAGHDLRPLLSAQQDRFTHLLDDLRVRPDSPTVVVDVWREELAHAVERTLTRLRVETPRL
jgi:PadR family transcriptional regulator AphA